MFKKIIEKNKYLFMFTTILSVLSSIVYVYAGYSLSFLVSEFGTVMQLNSLLRKGIIVFGIWGIALSLLYVYSICQQKLFCRMRTNLREIMAKKMISLKYTEFIKKDTGNYVSWMTNDVEQISKQVFDNFFNILDSLTQAVFSLIALFCFGKWIGLAAIGLFFVISFVPQILSKEMQVRTALLSEAQEVATEHFKEKISGYPIYYTSNRKRYFLQKIYHISNKLELEQYSFEKKMALLNVLGASVSVLGQVVLLLVSIAMAIMGITPLGAILSVGNLGQTFFGNVSNTIESIVSAKASKKLWEKYKITTNFSEKTKCEGDVSAIKIENLSYSYDEKKVLENVNLVFEKGKKYAIVGESGSGKTTLGKIVAGLLDNYEGNVYFDDLEVRNVYSNKLYNTVAYVDQQVFIFGESVRNNITLGEDYTDDKIWEILKICNLYDYVSKLENGLEHVIEENGKNLSGGQRQRIALARALIREVSYLILDEGTSSLDVKNASEIEEALVDTSNICLILISHHMTEKIASKMDSVIKIEMQE